MPENYDLFVEGIEKSNNIYQIMDWINRCRNYIKNKPDITTEAAKTAAIKDFTDAWKKHYENNRSFYQSEKYRKALVYNGVRRNQLNVIIGTEKIDLNSFFLYSIMSNANHSLINDFKEQQIDKWEQYWEKTDQLKREPSEGEKISKTILELIETSQTYYSMDYYIHPDTEDTDDPGERKKEIDKEIEALIPELKEYINNKDFEEVYEFLYRNFDDYHADKMIKVTPVPIKKMELLNILDDSDIKSTRWFEYLNELEKTIDADFFINLGILLSLDPQSMDTLLRLHGYSFKYSWTKKDQFLKQAIEIGFDHIYIKELGRQLDIPLNKKYYFIGSEDSPKQSISGYLSTIHQYEAGSKEITKKAYKEAPLFCS